MLVEQAEILLHHPFSALYNVFSNVSVQATLKFIWFHDFTVSDFPPLWLMIINRWKFASAVAVALSIVLLRTYLCNPAAILFLFRVILAMLKIILTMILGVGELFVSTVVTCARTITNLPNSMG